VKLAAVTVFLLAVQTPDGAPIRLVLPSPVTASSCEAHSFLIGPFGGVGDLVRRQRDDSVLLIATMYEGAVGTTLKAYLWCPGYEVWTLSFDTLAGISTRTITPSLTPRGTVPFPGVVRAWTAPPEPLSVHVNYRPSWTCAFFRLIDCGFGPWPIANVTIKPDGSFSVDLPDFAADGVIAAYGGAGDFEFSLRDKGGDLAFELRPSDGGAPLWRITPRPSDSAEQAFELEPRR
jgi:hypothetical protein